MVAGSTCQFSPAGLFGSLGGLSLWVQQRFLDSCRGLCGGRNSFSSDIGRRGRCWWRGVWPFELITPVIATIVQPLHKPLTGVLRVAQLVEAGGSCCPGCLSCLFELLPLLELFSKFSHALVQHQLPLDFLQDLLDFQIQLEFFKRLQQLFLSNLHFEMTPPAVRFLL